MMTQSSGVSPIDVHGTRQAGRRAKAFASWRRTQRSGARAVGPGMIQVSSPTPGAAARGPLRRLLLGASAPVALLASVCAVPAASAAAPPPGPDGGRAGDHLTVTVRHAGDGRDGTYEVYCHPDRGRHPDVRGACGALDRNSRWGRDTFAPVPEGSVCTMEYGGPATAHVTGTWSGRPVDTTYDRSNGCQIDRWNRLVPLLPDMGAGRRGPGPVGVVPAAAAASPGGSRPTRRRACARLRDRDGKRPVKIPRRSCEAAGEPAGKAERTVTRSPSLRRATSSSTRVASRPQRIDSLA